MRLSSAPASASLRICSPWKFRTVRISCSPSQSSLPSHNAGTGTVEAPGSNSNNALFWLLEPEFSTRIFMIYAETPQWVFLRVPLCPLWFTLFGSRAEKSNTDKGHEGNVILVSPFPVLNFRH